MTKEITSEILLVVANGVSPQIEGREWQVHKGEIWSLPLDHIYRIEYLPQEKSAQQLRIRDFLAEKGVVLFEYRGDYHAISMHNSPAFSRQISNAISTHKDINHCAILAAHAVIKGEG